MDILSEDGKDCTPILPLEYIEVDPLAHAVSIRNLCKRCGFIIEWEDKEGVRRCVVCEEPKSLAFVRRIVGGVWVEPADPLVDLCDPGEVDLTQELMPIWRQRQGAARAAKWKAAESLLPKTEDEVPF